MFTYGFQLNKDEFGMKASNGVTYLFSFKKYPKVNYPMAYLPKQDSIVFYLFKKIGNREFESNVIIALCEEHVHRVLTKFGIPNKTIHHSIWINMFLGKEVGLIQIALEEYESGKTDEWIKECGFL